MARLQLTLLLVAALACSSLPAWAAAPKAQAGPFRIDQSKIGRAPLGKTVAFYRAAYGNPGVRVLRGGGFDRLIFGEWHLEVLFRPGGKTAVGVITWAARVETGLGVGACSRTSTLISAYGAHLDRVAVAKTLTAYRLGRLVFVAGSEGFVRSVGLLAPGVSISPVLAAPVCGSPSVA